MLPEDAATIDRLLLSALGCFSEYGYHGTTTRRIAAGVGMSPAALYIYFPTKADLLARLVREIHLYIHGELEHVVAEEISPTRQLQAFIHRHIEFHVETPTAARVANYEMGALPNAHLTAVLKIRHSIQWLLGDVLTRGVSSGEFVTDNTVMTQTALLSLAIDVSRWSRAARRPPTTKPIVDAYWNLIKGMVHIAD